MLDVGQYGLWGKVGRVEKVVHFHCELLFFFVFYFYFYCLMESLLVSLGALRG